MRAAFAALAGFAATAAVALLIGPADLSRGVALGGTAGTLLSAVSSGAQVALWRRSPSSAGSFTAMVAGFLAKAAALGVGIFLLRGEGSPASPAAFALAFLGAAFLVSAVVLSAIARRPA